MRNIILYFKIVKFQIIMKNSDDSNSLLIAHNKENF